MSRPQPPKPAKLVVGVLLQDRTLVEALVDALQRLFGSTDFISRWMPFNYTRYYEAEMGAPLSRRMLSFGPLIEQASLARVKRMTNAVEKMWMHDGKRRVNLDPGCLLLERFVLATGKNYSHRIYVGEGIYADLTLIFRSGAFQPLPWTYPDYADDGIRSFLLKVRRKYQLDLAHEPQRSKLC